MKAQRSENGQAMVLIVLAIVGMFGFAALAVDGGRLYSERRRAQNAADAAALAASFAGVNQLGDPSTVALASALSNQFDNDQVTNTVTINNPPISGVYAGDSNYYQVIVWEKVNPIFIQFVYTGGEAVSAEAVAHAKPNTAASDGNAVHSLSQDCGGSSDSMGLDGTVDVSIDGANMFANGCWGKNGGSGKVRVTIDGHIKTDGIQTARTYTCNGCSADTVQPAIDSGVPSQSAAEIPQPYCPTHDEIDANGIHYYYHPAGLDAGVLPSGVHCIKGDTRLTGHNTISGRHVLLVFLDGGLAVEGGASLDLTRFSNLVINGYQYGGMLIYAPSSNRSTLTLGGDTNSHFNGTIYAPGATCDMGGTSATQANHTSLVCYSVKFHGTTGVNIVYRKEELFQTPPLVELAQ